VASAAGGRRGSRYAAADTATSRAGAPGTAPPLVRPVSTVSPRRGRGHRDRVSPSAEGTPRSPSTLDVAVGDDAALERSPGDSVSRSSPRSGRGGPGCLDPSTKSGTLAKIAHTRLPASNHTRSSGSRSPCSVTTCRPSGQKSASRVVKPGGSVPLWSGSTRGPCQAPSLRHARAPRRCRRARGTGIRAGSRR
jgi:hypothetical protein